MLHEQGKKMPEEANSIRVFKPLSINALSSLLIKYPNAILFAGGTQLMGPNSVLNKMNGKKSKIIIYLNNIDSLTRIRRKEKYLEIGACVTISRILTIGPNVIPQVLYEALYRIATPAIRNLATLGGNIAIGSPLSDSLLPLCLLDAKLELRNMNRAYWMPISQFLLEYGKRGFKAGEYLARIRIPLEEFSKQEFKKIRTIEHPAYFILKFCAAVRIYKGVISDLRVAFGAVNPLILRKREIEALLIGSKLPLTKKNIDFFLDELKKLIHANGENFLDNTYYRVTAIRLARNFVENLNYYYSLS
jgi:xanthine dehydrogenase FAD-binding subunit